MTPTVVVVTTVAAAIAALRWLRVAQREHYIAGTVTRFAYRWWTTGVNRVLAVLAIGWGVATVVSSWWGLAMAAVVAVAPWGLGLRGRTSPLVWTPRMARVGAVTGAILLTGAVAGWVWSPVITVVVALFVPLTVDIALAAMAPVESSLGSRWVDAAAAKLTGSGAEVVAITGSYGKTTTKSYLTHLLAGRRRALASPASFNNRMGLARAINEQLTPGTEVFIAEMGTYRRGEIAELCRWIPPRVAVITAIGPVHLERFGSEEAIVEAKSEILEPAAAAVISVDHELLRRLIAKEAGRRRIITCSSVDAAADVLVTDEGEVRVEGRRAGVAAGVLFPGNLACAVGAALAVGLSADDIASRLGEVEGPPHRLATVGSAAGFTVIDDTYNSNPAGARAALTALAKYQGRKVVVTPGMVELGRVQRAENVAFASAASQVADDLVVVGSTNRKALLEGSGRGTASVTVLPTRNEAVEWVRANLGPGDAVLYENDLPDHYP